MISSAGPPVTVDWPGALDRALTGDGVRPVFQPIVDLRRRTVVGYEGLTRFDHPTVAVGPDVWFREAQQAGAGVELEAVALRALLAQRPGLPRNCFLSVNVDPNHLVEPAVWDVLAGLDDLRALVIEFTEHRDWDWDQVGPRVEVLRRRGALVALDDAGAGYSGLQQMLQLRPSILKLDRTLVEGLDADEAKIALVEMMGVFANRIDAWIIAEGVETAAEARCLDRLSVPLVQGWFFGRPAAPWTDIDPNVVAVLGDTPLRLDPGLHRLVDPVPPVTDADVDGAAGWFDADDVWRVLVDADRRPVGIVDVEAAAGGFVHQSLIANVHSTPTEVAGRLATASGAPGAPVVVTDDNGRYLGVVPIRRLLAHLAHHAHPVRA